MATKLYFQRSGLQTTIQDMGRLGYQNKGIPVGGTMDKSSAQAANWLVGNNSNSPLLEVTILGPKIEIEGPCQIAITGADLSPTIDGQVIRMYQTINIQKKATLAFGRLKNGCRAYLAVGGQWQIQPWLGSYSTATNNGKMLTPHSFIREKSQLSILPNIPISVRNIPIEKQPKFNSSQRIRVSKGPEFNLFSAYSIGHFFSHAHPISPQSNRMGYRLDSKLIDFEPKQELISSGVIPGTIQISNSGQPIVLMKDAQTTGGYYRLGNVFSEDLDRLAQLKPGDSIWFSLE
ncbi:MAG: biotin-dependent carboxyltransferase family protein [Aureispira sp.]|nr:biotin-dependent carboxyltransferase family protein [Aureispira sp.]